MNTGFLIINFKELFHVGTMNIKDKGFDSLEGNGLSISVYPDEWRKITSLRGDLYSLTKEYNKFLNFHKLRNKEKDIIINYGIVNKYIEPCKIYNVCFYDENENRVHFSFEDYEKAKCEAEAQDPDDYKDNIEIVKAYKATDKMRERVLNRCEQILVLDLLSTIYTEDVLNIDGVCWNDNLDVYSYSAPRGVINLKNLVNWNVQLVKIL